MRKVFFLILLFCSCNNTPTKKDGQLSEYNLDSLTQVSILARSTDSWMIEYMGMYKYFLFKKNEVFFAKSTYNNDLNAYTIDELSRKDENFKNLIEHNYLLSAIQLMIDINATSLHCVDEKKYITLATSNGRYYYSKFPVENCSLVSKNWYYKKE
jgi:hypothetical protein